MTGDSRPEIRDAGQSRTSDSSVAPEMSVLLPTYNRADALQRTLQALERQSIDCGLFEIVVVDDGSVDDTDVVLNGFAKQTPCRFSYIVLQENGGPARARNAGLFKARGDVVLIIGDDIEPDSLLLEKHLSFHREHSDAESAMLGHVAFPEELSSNAFMRWLETDGRKYFFNYAELKAGQEVGPIFFYTCNVSVKRALLAESGWFDESFPYASHEDLELGYRLADKGMRLVYDPSARGYHWHELTINGIARRVYLMGHSADIFWQKIGASGSFSRRTARKILAGVCTLPPMIFLWNSLRKKDYAKEKSYPAQWHVLLFLGFFIGLADSQNNQKIRV